MHKIGLLAGPGAGKTTLANALTARMKDLNKKWYNVGEYARDFIDKFGAEALEKGIKHEMEHTENEQVAKEIAKDHLTESADYYDKLEEMKLSGVDIAIYRLMAAGK